MWLILLELSPITWCKSNKEFLTDFLRASSILKSLTLIYSNQVFYTSGPSTVKGS